jgi:hypothetical protein
MFACINFNCEVDKKMRSYEIYGTVSANLKWKTKNAINIFWIVEVPGAVVELMTCDFYKD